MSKQIFMPLLSMLLLALFGCDFSTDQYPAPNDYDLNHPVTVMLQTELNEISGIVYYPKDTSVFAISDETGWLYKIFPTRQVKVQKWKFGKNHDYEDLQLVDSIFYILSSTGDIVTIKFLPNDSMDVQQYKFPKEHKNEFETLYFDKATGLLNIICKNCKNEKKHRVSVWTFNPSTHEYNLSSLFIDVAALAKEFDKKKMELKPSAAAINPLTNELFILSSVNKLLVIADKNGSVKSAYPLNPGTYKQPEGIAFTPSGDLLISNESANEGSANILVIKYKKKHQ